MITCPKKYQNENPDILYSDEIENRNIIITIGSTTSIFYTILNDLIFF